MVVCFIGHKKIDETNKLVILLKETIETLINKGVDTFLFGSSSSFDNLSWRVVSELKEKYSYIKRVYVRSSYQYIDNAYKKYLLKYYEDTYFPSKLENAGKYSYVERNYEMIDKSTFCVFYYNSNYEPPYKRQSKRNSIFLTRRNSGTKIAYMYAVKKKKIIINLFK